MFDNSDIRLGRPMNKCFITIYDLFKYYKTISAIRHVKYAYLWTPLTYITSYVIMYHLMVKELLVLWLGVDYMLFNQDYRWTLRIYGNNKHYNVGKINEILIQRIYYF